MIAQLHDYVSSTINYCVYVCVYMCVCVCVCECVQVHNATFMTEYDNREHFAQNTKFCQLSEIIMFELFENAQNAPFSQIQSHLTIT